MAMRFLRLIFRFGRFHGLAGGVFLASALGRAAEKAEAPRYWSWAPTPVMGWNSWDAFATTLTEAQARTQAKIMQARLAPYGWSVFTVDIQWYEPNATGFDYRKDARLAMDPWGRLLPAENRFPSAAGGRGFKPLADFVHSLGLKFGLHLMRGIPRQAVAAKTPILGTRYTAADVADLASTCPWNGDMYGVDVAKPGAQAYYDSVFAQFAAWGLDFVKVDDLSTPYHQGEIEAIRRAIDRCGRPIVLSTSPGPTPVAAGAHISEHANLWRISGDFWDNWYQLEAQFDRLRDWTPFRGAGHFPDADMLPLGTLALGKRQSGFTPVEQVTLLSLWSIARSPLILGADLTRLDPATIALLTNPEVIAVDQASADNRELFGRDGLRAWLATVPGTSDRYLALFNTRPTPGQLDPARALYRSVPVTAEVPGGGAAVDVAVAGATRLYLVVDDLRGGDGGPGVIWGEPTLTVAGQAVPLTGLTWTSATSGHHPLAPQALRSGRAGLAVHAFSVLAYDLPADTTRFQAVAALDQSSSAAAGRSGPARAVRFMVFVQSPYATAARAAVPVRLAELGLAGPVLIRDLWARRDLGLVTGTFAPEILAHGAGLYRVSPVP